MKKKNVNSIKKDYKSL